jgi:hypothetical protein
MTRRRVRLGNPAYPPPIAAEDALTVFVPMQPVNPLNAREHYHAKARRVAKERAAVAQAVWVALRTPAPGSRMSVWRITAKSSTPKRVDFTVHVSRRFDDDALPAICKASRDALQDVGLIDTDGPDAGHEFTYAQIVRKPLGVTIAVRVKS